MFIEEHLPNRPLFTTADLIREYDLFSKSMLHKLIKEKKIDAVKIGVKYFIPREEVVRFFTDNLVSNQGV